MRAPENRRGRTETSALARNRSWPDPKSRQGCNSHRSRSSAHIAAIASPTLLIFSDADMMHLEHMVEFYKLLGGGTRDAGVDGSLRPTPNQLAIIPDTTHYDLMLKATRIATDHAKAFLAK